MCYCTLTVEKAERSQGRCKVHPDVDATMVAEEEGESGESGESGDSQRGPTASQGGSTSMEKYLNKHLKRCLPKEEREALSKEHPRLDLYSTVPPKVDKYLQEFLG